MQILLKAQHVTQPANDFFFFIPTSSILVLLLHLHHHHHHLVLSHREKRTLFEFATRVPFIMRVPWLPQSFGAHTDALVELVDVYPTLAELAGLPPPVGDRYPLDGRSFADVVANPQQGRPDKQYALSTYPRCPRGPIWNDECIHNVERTEFGYMGYTLRTPEWRYTELVGHFRKKRKNGGGRKEEERRKKKEKEKKKEEHRKEEKKENKNDN